MSALVRWECSQSAYAGETPHDNETMKESRDSAKTPREGSLCVSCRKRPTRPRTNWTRVLRVGGAVAVRLLDPYRHHCARCHRRRRPHDPR